MVPKRLGGGRRLALGDRAVAVVTAVSDISSAVSEPGLRPALGTELAEFTKVPGFCQGDVAVSVAAFLREGLLDPQDGVCRDAT